ncbi:MAG: thioredoxin [Rhodobacteraceae bacterium]|nr:thioredoxin [Paracoccaceae bacterium]
MATRTVTDATFDAEVRESDMPVLVDFGTEWCAPCKQLAPVLEEISTELSGKIKIVKVDLDRNPNTAAKMGVRGIPAMFLFKDGEVVANKTGAIPKAVLLAWIAAEITA